MSVIDLQQYQVSGPSPRCYRRGTPSSASSWVCRAQRSRSNLHGCRFAGSLSAGSDCAGSLSAGGLSAGSDCAGSRSAGSVSAASRCAGSLSAGQSARPYVRCEDQRERREDQ